MFTVSNLALPAVKNKRVELVALTEDGSVLATLSNPPPPRLPNGRPSRQPAPPAYAARYQNGMWKRFPIPPGADRVLAGDINDRGDIVGVSVRFRRGKPPYNRVVLYPAGSDSFVDVGTMDAQFADADTTEFGKMRGVGETGMCINNRGELMAFVGEKTWLRDAAGRVYPLGAGVASDMNDKGVAVGFGRIVGGTPLLWRDVFALNAPLPESVVPTRANATGEKVPVLRGVGQCVNNQNAVVVSVIVESSSTFRRQGITGYYLIRDHKIHEIGNFVGYQRFRPRMNEQNDVVGFVDTDFAHQTYRPYLYRGGELYDLSGAVSRTGWRIIGAIDINNRGQILAYGVGGDPSTRKVTPLLLTPTATPAPKNATGRRSN